MVPVKGVEVLIAAFSDLIEKYNDWHLWLVGDVNNDYGKSLVSLVKERKLETHIHLAGKRPNVKEYLDHAEIFVLPTKDEGRREGSPVAMLEAMANGKLVIGTNIPGVRDQLKEYNDHVVEPNNIDRLSGCLDSFMANSTTQNRKIGYKFLNHVKSGYTIEKEIERHVEFYNKILRQ
jgi:glycosyltransferase involved in cell wall biosynthesis